MRFFTLFAFVGFAAAARLGGDLKWEPEHEYVYSYKGRLLTGLPQLAEHHFSGIGIKCDVHLKVERSSRIVLEIRNPEYTKVNHNLASRTGNQDGNNWRHLQLPSYEPVPSETSRMLSQPTVFEVSEETGKVHSVTVSSEEPEWSVNFKKALIVLFQTQTIESDTVRTNSLSEFSESRPTSSYWTTMEESVDGECETRYELNELPRSLIVDEELSTSSGTPVCPGHSGEESTTEVYEMIKARNVNRCNKRNTFSFYKPGGFSNCETGNCGGMWARSSVTRYVICGRPGNYVIQKIVNEGELNQDLMGFKSEKMLTGTRQEMKLVRKERRSSVSSVSGPSSPITLDNLGYEYSVQKSPERLQSELNTPSSLEKTLPALGSALKSGHKEEVVRQIKELITQLVNRDLFTPEGLPEKQVTMKVLGLARGFLTLDTEEMERIYREMKGEFSEETKRTTFKNVFFDTCAMSGSGASVRFVKRMILAGETSRIQTESLLLALPRSLVTPTTHILEEIFELVTSSKIREMGEHSNVYNSGILSFTTLVQKACLSDNHNVSYPTFVFGKFCHKESAIVSDRLIPYLTRELRETRTNEKRNVYVVALGLLSHKNILPTLYTVIENTEEYTPLTRSLATYALVNVGRHYPSRVLPVVSAIFSNRAERTEIRVAAFDVIIKLNPDMALLQKIATQTWTETDFEVLKVVNTAFYSLSEQISMQDVKPASASLVRKVRLLYPLIKKTGGKFPTSGSIFVNDYLNRLYVGYERTTSWINPKDTPIPTDYYSKITYFMDEYKFTPIEYSFRMRGTGSMIQEILQLVTGKGSSSSKTSEDEIISKLSGEWRKVIEKLNIKTRKETDKPEGSMYINFLETSPIFKSFSYESAESIRNSVHEVLKNPSLLKSKLGLGLGGSGSGEFSFQRMLNLAPRVIMIPSDMGLPIMVEVHLPLTMSVRGTVQDAELSLSRASTSISMKSMLAVQYVGWVSTICPFTDEKFVTGIDEHVVINVPAEFSMSVSREEQKASIKVKPMSSSTISTPIDLFHYHVRPFTVKQKIYDIKPMTLSSEFKPIKSRTELKTYTSPVLDYFGLGLNYVIASESPVLKASNLMEKASMYNNNLLDVFRFSLVSTAFSPARRPSIRRHEIKIKYNPSQATTREFDMTIKYGYATKESSETPIKYHTIKVHESGMSSGEKKLIPFGLESRPIGEKSGHVLRQRKIKEIMEKSSLSSGTGVSVSVTGTFLGGSRPRTFTYAMTAGFGKDSRVNSKWDVKLETSHSESKICLSGSMELPLSSTLDSVHELRSSYGPFRFTNTLGFGPTCERKIKVVGSAKTSESQKEISRKSPEAKEYQRLVEQRSPLAHLSEVAEKVRVQASTLDEVDFDVEYINVPSPLLVVNDRIIDLLKIYWLPYYRYSTSEEFSGPSSSGSSSIFGGEESSKVRVGIYFSTEKKTFSLKIEREGREPVRFTDIRLPYPLSYYFPGSHVAPMSPIVKGLLGGESVLPVCRVEKNYMRTYDNETARLSVDECFHLLSGDCGRSKDFAVMIRKKSGEMKEIKVFLKETSILLTPEGSSSARVYVNGSTVSISSGSSLPIKDNHGSVILTLEKSTDGVIILKSTWVNVIFKGGELIKVEPSPIYRSKLCGMCGNLNSDKKDELVSPRMCLLSKPKLLAASYRVPLPSQPCRPLEENIKSELRRETVESCHKPGKTIPTKIGSGLHGGLGLESVESGSSYSSYSSSSSYGVSSSYSSSGSCYKRAHTVVIRGNRTCFSRFPLMHCKSGCRPTSEEREEISFHCMESILPSTKRLLERVRSGEIIPSLARTVISLDKFLPVPETCTRS